MESSKKNGFSHTVKKILTDVRYTVTLIIVMVVYISLATLVPVDDEGLVALTVLRKMGLTDLYNTWFAALLVALLLLNLLVCTYYRLRPTWRLYSSTPLLRSLEQVKFGVHRVVDGPLVEIVKRLEGQGYQVGSYDPEHAWATRGRVSRWGATVTHLGLVIVLICGIARMIVGITGTIKIYTATPKNQYYNWEVRDFRPLADPITLTDVQVGYHPPQATIVLYDRDNGLLVEQVKLKEGESRRVTYQGVAYTLRLRKCILDAAIDESGRVVELSTLLADPAVIVQLDSKGETAHFALFKNPDLNRITPESQIQLHLADIEVVMNHAAARFQVGGSPSLAVNVNEAVTYKQWNYYLTDVGNDQFRNRWVGLQLVYDPTIVFVWVGLFIICLGVTMSFGITHLGLWLVVSGGQVYICGQLRGARPGVSLQLDCLVRKLNKL